MKNSFTGHRSGTLATALCSAQGDFETLYGQSIQPLNPQPFVEALLQGEQRVAVGVDSLGNEVVLFGVGAAYPMRNGGKSTGLIAAVPLEYITDFLSLEDEKQLMSYFIIRPDGSFVIQSPNTEYAPFFEQLRIHLNSQRTQAPADSSLIEFGDAIKSHGESAAAFQTSGEECQIYGIPLPYSEWYLVSSCPTAPGQFINILSVRLSPCCPVPLFLLLTLIFFGTSP
ncbi:MAG: cache domain-containing protein [Oscillospiraceae bacterium]